MARLKIKLTELDPKRMVGRQVVLQVEKVNVELGEILCTPVAISPDIADGAIDLVKDKDYTVTISDYVKPVPRKPTEQEVLRQLMGDIAQLEAELFMKGSWKK